MNCQLNRRPVRQGLEVEDNSDRVTAGGEGEKMLYCEENSQLQNYSFL